MVCGGYKTMENDHQLRILYLYQILLRHSDVDHPCFHQRTDRHDGNLSPDQAASDNHP